MITKAERDADAAILAAATCGTWITVAPRSQEGGVQLAGFGGLDAPDVAVSLRVAAPMPRTGREHGEVALAQALMPWEQHAANAKAAVHAVNRLPAYIEAAAETERRIEKIEADIARRDATDRYDDQRGYTNGMRRALAELFDR